MSKKLVFLFGLVGIYNLFVFHAFGSTGFVIAASTLYLFVLGVFWNEKLPVWPTLLIAALSVAMIRSANGLVNAVSGLTVLGTIFWTGYLMTAKKNLFLGIGEFILAPFALVWSYLLSILDLFKFKPGGKFFSIFRGLVLAVPIIMVVMGLLAAGDPAYNSFVADILKNIQRLFVHIIFTLILFGIMLPYTFLKLRLIPKKIYDWSLPIATEINVVIGLVITALGSFLIVQWPYVFVKVAAETSLTKFGVATYSEYVNRGFGEFILVALIVYVLAWAGVWIKKVSPWLQALLFGEFAIFIVSIFRRIALYQQYHGWTLARIYGGFLLVLVAGLMGILAWRYVSKKNLLSAELAFAAIIILVFSWFPAENFVAPTVNNNPDYVYLSRLSTDGYEGWKKSYFYVKEVLERPYYLKPVLNREDRREIAYAQLILINLLNQQSHLKSASRSGELNKVLVYNYSEARASQRWSKEIPRDDLERLYQRYVDLNKRIQSQPENERDWDHDISMESPFL